MLAKLINCFNNDGISNVISESLDYPNICKVYTNCYLQNMLRTFYRETDTFNKDEDVEMKQEGQDGWKEFGLPVLGSLDKFIDCPLTNYPEHVGNITAKYHMLKDNQNRTDADWEEKLLKAKEDISLRIKRNPALEKTFK